jgi:hypothetical protein
MEEIVPMRALVGYNAAGLPLTVVVHFDVVHADPAKRFNPSLQLVRQPGPVRQGSAVGFALDGTGSHLLLVRARTSVGNVSVLALRRTFRAHVIEGSAA